jgi:endonuclease YncB( thermonuclease family)
VSLNHKRRIFRSNAGVVSKLPSVGVWLATAGGAATLVIVASLFVRSSDAPARQPVSGHLFGSSDQLAVLDGATLRVDGHVVRLEGIVAPARGTICHGADRSEMDCGSAAANALATLVRSRNVDCIIRGHDDLGRPIGDCAAAGKALNVALVQDGWARAAAAALSQPEAAARAAGRGVWRSGL